MNENLPEYKTIVSHNGEDIYFDCGNKQWGIILYGAGIAMGCAVQCNTSQPTSVLFRVFKSAQVFQEGGSLRMCPVLRFARRLNKEIDEQVLYAGVPTVSYLLLQLVIIFLRIFNIAIRHEVFK